MKKIVVLSNHHAWTYNLRSEVLEALVKEGHRVIVVVGYGKKVEDLKTIGCEHIDVPFNRHGKNPFDELKLLLSYKRILKNIKPDVVLSYTIKPNLYGAFLCHRMNIPCIANITGLGTAIEYPGMMQKVLLKVYKVCFRNIYKVFFQNTANRDLFLKYKLVDKNYGLLPGSGVNVEKFSVLPYADNGCVEYVFISRIMKEKGIEQYLFAAKELKMKYSNTKFHICGFCEQSYEEIINQYVSDGVIIYHGMVDDVRTVLRDCQCLVLPTYYPEGMSNVLLESAASGRAIITTNRPGCREIIDDGKNGYIVKAEDNQDLLEKMERFYLLSHEEKENMGLAGREKVETTFNRQIIVEEYIKAINEING